jgi:protein-tyrosine phosphatase
MAGIWSELAVGGGRMVLSALPAGPALRAEIEKRRPDLVLSLTESHEMKDAGAGDLGSWLAGHGLNWRHHPVADFSVPGHVSGWPGVEASLRTVLEAGGLVWVHCRAGLGRSGAVALRVMVATGEAPGPALARLRATRPGAVETDAQVRWASGDAATGV